jgi:hypothetical protein
MTKGTIRIKVGDTVIGRKGKTQKSIDTSEVRSHDYSALFSSEDYRRRVAEVKMIKKIIAIRLEWDEGLWFRAIDFKIVKAGFILRNKRTKRYLVDRTYNGKSDKFTGKYSDDILKARVLSDQTKAYCLIGHRSYFEIIEV